MRINLSIKMTQNESAINLFYFWFPNIYILVLLDHSQLAIVNTGYCRTSTTMLSETNKMENSAPSGRALNFLKKT